MIKTKQTINFRGQQTTVTMFQDAEGTIPATEAGQPVGFMMTFEPPLCFDGDEDGLVQAQCFRNMIEDIKQT